MPCLHSVLVHEWLADNHIFVHASEIAGLAHVELLGTWMVLSLLMSAHAGAFAGWLWLLPTVLTQRKSLADFTKHRVS
jgi:hypothetical protein